MAEAVKFSSPQVQELIAGNKRFVRASLTRIRCTPQTSARTAARSWRSAKVIVPTASYEKMAETAKFSSPQVQELIAGNKRFVEGKLEKNQTHSANVSKFAQGQSPHSIVLSCSDSRVPVESIFDQGLGDVFVVRVAGNVVGTHALGSIYYALENLGSRNVVVLGHTKCGAVGAAVDLFHKLDDSPPSEGEDPIVNICKCIKPAVAKCAEEKGGGDIPTDLSFKLEASKCNACLAAENLATALSKRLKEDIRKDVQVAAAIYNLDDGTVDFLEELKLTN